MSLASFGVSAADERIYRFVLRRPGVNPASAAQALGLDQTAVDEAAGRLAQLGLVRLTSEGVLTAADPQHAMDQLVHRHVAEVNDQLRRITAAQATLPSLLVERSAGQPVELIERIEDRNEVQQRIWQAGDAAQECLSIHSIRPTVDQPVRERTLQRLRDGVIFRTVVHASTLADPAVAAYFHEIHRAGDRHRVTDEAIQTMIICDRATAFVPIEPSNPRAGALMVRQPGVVATLVDLFEQTWAHATDLEPQEPQPTPEERQVLDLLNRLGKDDVAARAMGVSVRTFRGRVALLMARLGAGNRFQAGVRAKERGWI